MSKFHHRSLRSSIRDYPCYRLESGWNEYFHSLVRNIFSCCRRKYLSSKKSLCSSGFAVARETSTLSVNLESANNGGSSWKSTNTIDTIVQIVSLKTKSTFKRLVTFTEYFIFYLLVRTNVCVSLLVPLLLFGKSWSSSVFLSVSKNFNKFSMCITKMFI